ncbi:hypothetical protein CEUSTIGMA_g8736.t1 [Chlamydomonas eustigma]|uniref:GYF domain-containing protein n=1 Tax=Chlamydomonas eustigma TaxID=1157962 RepID=A0A250XE00_9CHLO|nr:hypothetical protein CEUSTIGMA_g8736.t1 [Chlamydomonas eustigma]|eukprot:GAX81305.1 hypothetical protein CEUSTIGMA_g8736.t1 [Chlamydomonas eustigma]
METTDNIPLSPQWKYGKANQPPLKTTWDTLHKQPNKVYGAGGMAGWREDERDLIRKEGERWGGNGDDTSSKWVPQPLMQDGVRTSLVNERWVPPPSAAPGAPPQDLTGRGRGVVGAKPEDRWVGNRDKDPWGLPGMGETDAAAKRQVAIDRWGGDGTTPDSGRGTAVDRWRSPGAAANIVNDVNALGAMSRGRGFALGRGRGLTRPGAPGAPGVPDRWDAVSLHPRSSVEIMNGNYLADGVRRYNTKVLNDIRQSIVSATGGNLPAPPALLSAAVDYPELLPGEPLPEPQPMDPSLKRWASGLSSTAHASSLHDPTMTPPDTPYEEELAGPKAWVSPQAFAVDKWMYRDPQGVIQGPFPKVDILEWLASGFFPNDLPIRSATEPDAPFVPLAAMVKMWEKIDHGAAPPGFVPQGHYSKPVVQTSSVLQQQQPLYQPPLHSISLTNGAAGAAVGSQLNGNNMSPLLSVQPPIQPQNQPSAALISPYDPIHKNSEEASTLGMFHPSTAPQLPSWAGAKGNEAHLQTPWQAPSITLSPPPLPVHNSPALFLGRPGTVEAGRQFPNGPAAVLAGHATAPQGSPQGTSWGMAHSGLNAWLPPSNQQLQKESPVPPPQPQTQQQQPGYGVVAWGGAAGLNGGVSSNLIGHPSGETIKPASETTQNPTAVETLVHTKAASHLPAQEAAVTAATAAKVNNLANMPVPLQQLFVAAQRVAQQPQVGMQSPLATIDAPVLKQPTAATAPEALVTAAPAPPPPQPPERKKLVMLDQATAHSIAASGEAEAAVEKVEPKVAPWAALTAKGPVAKTLREIQEEEAQCAAQEQLQQQQQQQLASAGVPSVANAGGATASSSAWSKVAATGGPPAGATLVSEQKARGATLNPAAAAAVAAATRGVTIGEILDRQLNPNPAPKAAAWGGSAAGGGRQGPTTNMRDIMFEESAADLEGGNVDEDDITDLLPPQPMSMKAAAPAAHSWAPPVAPIRSLKEVQEEEERAARQRQAHQASIAKQNAAPAAAEDDELFWEYPSEDNSHVLTLPPPPPPPPATRPSGMTAAAVAAKGLPPALSAAKVVPTTASKGAWAATAQKASPPAVATPMRTNVAPSKLTAAHPATARPLLAPAASHPPSVRSEDDSPIMFGDIPLSRDFKDWCREQLKRLINSEDFGLIDVLLAIESRSEVADMCQMVMGNKTGIGAFVAEFLKRKDAEVLRHQQTSKKKKGGSGNVVGNVPTNPSKGKAK